MGLKKIGNLGWAIDFQRQGFGHRARLTHMGDIVDNVMDCKLSFFGTEVEAKYNFNTRKFTNFTHELSSDITLTSLKCPKELAIRIEVWFEDLGLI